MSMIETISFDLWDTLIVDDSDEPKRARLGKPPKNVERVDLVYRALAAEQPFSRELVEVACATANAGFKRVWHDQAVTWTVRERLAVILEGLGRALPAERLAELVQRLEDMEVEVVPDLVPGAKEALDALRGTYRLALVSDAIFSPGRALRQILRHHGLVDHFDAFVFSDEVGCSKPNPRVFEVVARQTGCELAEIVHLGDRESKDVDGPHAAGARAILVTVAIDRGSEGTNAEATCRDYADLPHILEELST